MVRRCKRANRKIRQEEENQEEYLDHTKQEMAGKGNGKAIRNICCQENMIPMNTWKKAPLTKEEKQQIRQSTNKELHRNEIELNNINTWTSPDGQVLGQIDYIMINNKYRNAVRKACAEQRWRGNMAQQRQHATIRMDIALKLVRNYHKKPTGNRKTHKI